ncbi:metal-dependent hydrolase [Euryarchaeota archaeon ex4484_162]|nr:MAG: metal-dependent hydrolase [Euryarchaeota archaeon ex4484_162]
MIIFDNHLHLRRDGRFIEAVKDFKKAGGTHLVLCQYPMPELVIKYKSYKPCYHETLKMADEIKKKLDIDVFVTVAPYPVDYLKLSNVFGRDKTLEIMKKGIDLAARLCEDKKCIGIGEIGRPHFPVDRKIIEDCNELLLYSMQKAKDADAAVVIHAETATPEQCKEFVELGKKAGLKPHKIVKHFSPPLVLEKENHGLMPSILASKKNITEALKKGNRFLMETDYIDDPKRPGAVLGPRTVPKVTKNLLENEVMTEKQAYMIHKENPEKTYDIILEK